MVPLIGKVSLPLVIVPLTSLRLALIPEVSTVLVVVVVLRDFTLTRLALLLLIQMILSTKGTLDTFSCGGWWSSPAINNHCTRVSASRSFSSVVLLHLAPCGDKGVLIG
ncbi:hypothetical protein TIFTF001_041296 [Ficus carica]|uniref:Uncharacterized protein n=1 Tax=Ficus carica TaxID=3494 RepID=A0AA87ZMG8_FICCA|nr:hypothetical protein TIFTF001_041296 [Ficus carica]